MWPFSKKPSRCSTEKQVAVTRWDRGGINRRSGMAVVRCRKPEHHKAEPHKFKYYEDEWFEVLKDTQCPD